MDNKSKERFRRWYAANRDRICATNRERYRADAEYRATVLAQRHALYVTTRETTLALARERYASDPEYRAKCLAHQKALRMRNPEAYRTQSRRRLEDPLYREANRLRAEVWRREHPGQAQANTNRWHKANPIRRRAQGRVDRALRRARLLGVPTEKIVVEDIAARDGWRCHICGKRVARANMSLDHLIPVSKGGPHLKVNVALAHLLCNIRRGAGRIPAQLRLS